MSAKQQNIISLDIGEKRIGVAIASKVSKLPRPLRTIATDGWLEEVQKIIDQEEADCVVVGLPVGLSGNETDQTRKVRIFVKELQESQPNIEVYLQDEALTSVKAEETLSGQKGGYQKSDVDKLAATYILEDFISENKEILSK
jgi:putative Holliday junction resolvase